jgi:hypothetical protein
VSGANRIACFLILCNAKRGDGRQGASAVPKRAHQKDPLSALFLRCFPYPLALMTRLISFRLNLVGKFLRILGKKKGYARKAAY